MEDMTLQTHTYDLTLFWWENEGQYIGILKDFPDVFNKGDTLTELKDIITKVFRTKKVLEINDSLGEPEERPAAPIKEPPVIPDKHSACDLHIEILILAP